MEPKIVTKGAFKVIGIQVGGSDWENVDFMGAWNSFIPRTNEVAAVSPIFYGVCECLGENGVRYIAGVEAANLDSIPADMVGIEIPEGRYAVFTHKGLLDTAMDTYNQIYQVWMPASGLEMETRPQPEIYDERFIPNSPDSEFDIYVPIK